MLLETMLLLINSKILNNFNSEVQLKNAEFLINNKLKDLFKFVITLNL